MSRGSSTPLTGENELAEARRQAVEWCKLYDQMMTKLTNAEQRAGEWCRLYAEARDELASARANPSPLCLVTP